MGKRRKKFHKYNSNPQSTVPQASVASGHSDQSHPVMDKQTSVYQAHQAEYKIISRDLIRVAVINGTFLAIVIALYFVDKRNPFLDSWFHKIF